MAYAIDRIVSGTVDIKIYFAPLTSQVIFYTVDPTTLGPVVGRSLKHRVVITHSLVF